LRKLGRFTKAEILEAEARFHDGQSIYKIGRDMKRKQRPIKLHLINLGLMDEGLLGGENIEYSKFNYTFFDTIIFGVLLALVPSLLIVIFIFCIYLIIRIWIVDKVIMYDSNKV